jgi:hypothetical protein
LQSYQRVSAEPNPASVVELNFRLPTAGHGDLSALAQRHVPARGCPLGLWIVTPIDVTFDDDNAGHSDRAVSCLVA